MKKTFTLTIPEPCHENWRAFAPTEKGGFCGACQKEVIDFTTWSEQDIKNYFQQRRGAVCGKFRPHQLRLYRDTAPRKGWMPSLITFALLIISRPAEAQTTAKPHTEEIQKIDRQITRGDTTVASMMINGVVLDASDRTAIPGVNITQQGTENTFITDTEGKFQFRVDNKSDSVRLTFSFVGYETKTLTFPRVLHYETEVEMLLDMSVLGGIAVGGVVALPWYSPRRWWWKVRTIFR